MLMMILYTLGYFNTPTARTTFTGSNNKHGSN